MPRKPKDCRADDKTGSLESTLLDFRRQTEQQFAQLFSKVNEVAVNVATLNAVTKEQREQNESARVDHEGRIRGLEKSAWKLAGMGAAGAMIASVIAWGLGWLEKKP